MKIREALRALFDLYLLIGIVLVIGGGMLLVTFGLLWWITRG